MTMYSIASSFRVDNFQLGIDFILGTLHQLKANTILRVVLMCFVTLVVSEKDETLTGCYSPQYIEIGTEGVIQCQFPSDFRAIYWFDNVTNEDVEPALSYKNAVKDGPGYDRGEFDIFPNGSLIIKETSLLHEKTFKVICFGASELYNLFHISVIATVSPIQIYPQISKCVDSSELCFVQEHKNDALSCRLNASRPASTVEWFVQLGEGQKFVNSSKTVDVNPDSTFNTIAIFNLSVSGDNVLAMFSCGSMQEHIGDWKYKSVLIEFLENPSLALDSLNPVYFTMNGLATLRCPLYSTNHIHRVVLWKKKFISRVENIALWAKANLQTSEIFDNEYSVGSTDGSLVISSVKLNHEGNYTCIASSFTTSDTVESFQLVVIVPPLPPYITISKCPTLEECTVVSSGTGEVTCTVSGVRPLVTFEWSTTDDSKIHFQKEETSTKEQAGLFYVSSTLYYKLSADIECGGVSFVSCSAHSVSAMAFPSVRELEIVNVKCSRDTTDLPSKSVIIVIAILGILITGIVGTFLAKCLLKRFRKANNITEDKTVELPLLSNTEECKLAFIKELKITYKELLLNFPSSQLTSIEYEELASKVYIPNKLSMKIEQKISSPNTALSLSYKELLKREDLADKHIVIEGGPGQGKTSFIMHLIKEWIESDNESPLNQFDILIMFSLKDMNQDKTFTDMIVETLLAVDSNLTSENIDDILKEEDRYLILLDDFEQYPQKHEKESTVHNIITRKLMRGSKIILMTRPTISTKTLSKGIAFLTLEDFSTSQIYEYFQLFVGKEQEHLGEILMAKFQEDDNFALMCRTPLFLFMFACLFIKRQYEEETFFSSTTVFEKLLLPLTYIDGAPATEAGFKASFEHQHSKGIAKVAIDGIQSSQFSWSKVDLVKVADNQHLKKMMRFGILKEVDRTSIAFHYNLKEQTNLKFSHDMYQYFYGAIYLAFHVPANEFDRYLHLVDAYTYQQLLVFTCGLSRKENVVTKIVKYLLSIKDDCYPFPIRDCIIQCLMEVPCDDWNDRKELLEELCKREYALSIRDDDRTTMKNAKAFLISICSKQSIPFNVLALCKVIKKMSGRSVSIDSGAALNLSPKVKLLSITDFEGIVMDTDVMFLIENTANLTEIFVYSNLLPTNCTPGGLDVIKEGKVTTLWITYANESVVTVSFPSISHGVWLRFEEVIIILYMRYCKQRNDLSEEEKSNREQDILAQMKKKDFKQFLEMSDEFNQFERSLLAQVIEEGIKTIEDLINEWFWVYEASNDETAEEHSTKFKENVTQFQNRLKMLERYMPGKSFPIEIFQTVGLKDIQYQEEDKMRPLSATLKHILQEIQL